MTAMRALFLALVLGACASEPPPAPLRPLASDAVIAAAEAAPLRGDEVAWDAPFEPFTVIGNIHYVGVSGVSAFLITTPEGHFLLDGGLPQSRAADHRQHRRRSAFRHRGRPVPDQQPCPHGSRWRAGAVAARERRRCGRQRRRSQRARSGRRWLWSFSGLGLSTGARRSRDRRQRYARARGRHAYGASHARPHAWLHLVEHGRARGRWRVTSRLLPLQHDRGWSQSHPARLPRHRRELSRDVRIGCAALEADMFLTNHDSSL